MILPAPRTDRGRQRFVAAAGAFVLLVGLQAGLRGLAVPSLGSASAHVRKLDPLFVERYTAPPPPPTPASTPEAPPPATETAVLDQEVSSAIEELNRRFGAGDGALAGSGVARVETPDIAGPGIAADDDESRFRDVFGATPDLLPPPATPRAPTAAPRSAAGGADLRIGMRPRRPAAPPANIRDEAETGGIAVDAPTRRATAVDRAANVELKEFREESFSALKVDALASWMRTHAATLPVGVRVHLNYAPAFLTAAAPLVVGPRTFELYLMYNESLRELHIVLVEGDRSVYLIDRGFQERTRSMREGRVTRVDGEIMTVDSHRGAASGERAQEFYNIFLSWWEAVSRQ